MAISVEVIKDSEEHKEVIARYDQLVELPDAIKLLTEKLIEIDDDVNQRCSLFCGWFDYDLKINNEHNRPKGMIKIKSSINITYKEAILQKKVK